MKPAYYNENDPNAAAWLRELIRAGHIAPGDVDTRSVEDVIPADLAGFGQCHFFAGIGGWSLALRNAGWPDDRAVWTGSCPCQPFSAAGKGAGFADKRHLWPSLFHLISVCRPATVFGEQVASKDGLAWFDLVQSDMEGAGYACGAVDTCSAGIGAPHIRQRLYWLAYTQEPRFPHGRDRYLLPVTGENSGNVGGVADAENWNERGVRQCRQAEGAEKQAGRCCSARWLGDAQRTGLAGHAGHGDGKAGRSDAVGSTATTGDPMRPGPVNGFWQDADWILCRDGKWRATEPGTSPLAHGIPSRVVKLRGFGNAINVRQAQAFIEAWLEISEAS